MLFFAASKYEKKIGGKNESCFNKAEIISLRKRTQGFVKRDVRMSSTEEKGSEISRKGSLQKIRRKIRRKERERRKILPSRWEARMKLSGRDFPRRREGKKRKKKKRAPRKGKSSQAFREDLAGSSISVRRQLKRHDFSYAKAHTFLKTLGHRTLLFSVFIFSCSSFVED